MRWSVNLANLVTMGRKKITKIKFEKLNISGKNIHTIQNKKKTFTEYNIMKKPIQKIRNRDNTLRRT